MMRLSTRAIAVGLVIVAAGAAFAFAAAMPSTKPSTGTVTGVVIDAEKNPVADCVVSATQAAQRMRVAQTAQTDKDGKFSIELAAGSWTLTATTKDAKRKGVKSVDVEPGKAVDAGKILLRPRTVGAR